MPAIFLLILFFLLLEYTFFTGFTWVLSWFLPGNLIPAAILAELALSAWFGYRLLQNQRRESLRLLQAQPQAEVLLKSLSLMIAGILLLIPGILTDVLGLLLIKGPGRGMLAKRMDRFNPEQGMFRFFYSGQRVDFNQFREPARPGKHRPKYSQNSSDEVIDIEARETQK